MRLIFQRISKVIFLGALFIFLCLPTSRVEASDPDPYSPYTDTTPPIIDVWYGPHQVFGKIGLPQQWINILGNVSDPECAGIALNNCLILTYTLNDTPGSPPLRIGSDERRLYEEGDFNIEIDKDSPNLVEGNNILVITATNPAGLQSTSTVTVEFYRSNTWYMPYSINWSTVTNIQDVAQIVDGKWEITTEGIHTTQVGYDRVLAIGDMAWDDYEILARVIIHSIDTTAWSRPLSYGPGLGIVLRWLGHTNDPDTCQQPHCGWLPQGGSNWYEWTNQYPNPKDDILKITANPPSGETHTPSTLFREPGTYWFRARVETIPSGNDYSLKVWRDNTAEPLNWTLQRRADPGNLSHGSLILVAHHVDATFGNIMITPFSPIEYSLTISISGKGWVQKDPDKPTYHYGDVVTLTAVPESNWSFTGWKGDYPGNENPLMITIKGDTSISSDFQYRISLPIIRVSSGSSSLSTPSH